MKKILEVCLLICAAATMVAAQDPKTPVLREGIHVQLPQAAHAIEMKAADQLDATVVAITADGKLYVGTDRTTESELAKINAGTIYLKVDARAPVRKLVSVLDALHGHALVLLTEAAKAAQPGKLASPYGLAITQKR